MVACHSTLSGLISEDGDLYSAIDGKGRRTGGDGGEVPDS